MLLTDKRTGANTVYGLWPITIVGGCVYNVAAGTKIHEGHHDIRLT